MNYFSAEQVLEVIAIHAKVTKNIFNRIKENAPEINGINSLEDRLKSFFSKYISSNETNLTKEEMDGENAIDKSKTEGGGFWEH